MTRTEAIIAAIIAALEARSAQIDADDGLFSAGVTVKIDQKTRQPGMVIWRPESQSIVKADRTHT